MSSVKFFGLRKKTVFITLATVTTDIKSETFSYRWEPFRDDSPERVSDELLFG
ncbi:hypothetical protein GCM10027347_54360 [Larkinella harenae]